MADQESTRDLLLEAGARLIAEPANWNIADGMSIKNLLEEAGGSITRRSFNAIWPTRTAYVDDLVLYVLRRRLHDAKAAVDQILNTPRELASQVSSPQHLLVEGVHAAIRELHASNRVGQQLTFIRTYPDRPEVIELVRDTAELRYQEIETTLQLMFAIYRLRPSEGVTTRQIAIALTAIVEGFATRWHVFGAPERPEPSESRAVQALLEAMTEFVES